MKKFIVVFSVLIYSPALFALIILNDGQSHTIGPENSNYFESFRLHDGATPPLPDVTQLNILNGAQLERAEAYGHSIIQCKGGEMGFLGSYDRSQIIMTGGRMLFMDVSDEGYADIRGGELYSEGLGVNDSGHAVISGGNLHFAAMEQSNVEVKGGQINEFTCGHSSHVTLYGTGFKVNGVNVGEGTLLQSSGRITGILETGDTLDCNFWRSGSSIITLVEVPEPVTFALLTLGGVSLRKRK